MKIRLASDLHLEFTSNVNYIDGLIPELPGDEETILVLLGDIHVGIGAKSYIEEIAKRFMYVIYVLGNHEFYHNNFYALRDRIEESIKSNNVFVPENEVIVIDGQAFACCTLWSDAEKECSFAERRLEKGVNDYRLIKTSKKRTLKVADTVKAHKDSLSFLRREIDNDTIVLTHHVPILNQLGNPMYNNSPIQGAFESDLYDLILETQPKYWLYGHNHYNVGVTTIENTKLISNQAGYITEPMNDYDPEFVLEI